MKPEVFSVSNTSATASAKTNCRQGNNLHKTNISGECGITKILEKKHGLKRSIYTATPALEENNGLICTKHRLTPIQQQRCVIATE